MNQSNTTPLGLLAEPATEQIEALLDQLDLADAGNLIGILQQVQEHFGYLPAEALARISNRTRIPLSRIYGVVSFYAQFYTSPHGRHTVLCCRGTACHVKGGGQILQAVERTLGIEQGQSTPDLKFYLETVACLGTCFLGPVIMIDDQYFGKLTPQRVANILEQYPD